MEEEDEEEEKEKEEEKEERLQMSHQGSENSILLNCDKYYEKSMRK